MTTSADEQIRSVLEPGERLLWCGRPRPYPRFDIGVVLMVLLLAALMIGVGRGAQLAEKRDGAETSLVLVVALFLLVPVGFLVYLLVIGPRVQRRTAYGVTDRRAILMFGPRPRNAQHLRLERSTPVMLRSSHTGVDWWRRTKTGDSIGSIYFSGYTTGSGEVEHVPSFSRVENAQQVFDLIEHVKRQGSPDC